MTDQRERAKGLYGKLYIDERGDVSTVERDIGHIVAALADERRRAFQSVLEELRERFLEDDELIQWVQAKAQAGEEGT